MAVQSPAGQGGDVGRMRDESRLIEQLVAPSVFHLLGALRVCAATTMAVGVEILASARRHGISDDDIRHAVENSLGGSRADDGAGLVMLVGPDQSGNVLELALL